MVDQQLIPVNIPQLIHELERRDLDTLIPAAMELWVWADPLPGGF